MKEIYIAGSLLLGGIAVYSTVSAVGYKYKAQSLPSSDFIPRERETTNDPEPLNISGDVIYEKNAFDINRGDEDLETVDAPDETQEVKGSYTFELRGIINIGKSPVALFSTKLNGKSSAARGRTSSRSVIAANSEKIYNCRVGAIVGDTQYTVQSIEDGQVSIKDDKGNEQNFTFSLTSDESLERSEMAFKNDQARQKTFAKQNSFTQPKTPTAAKQPPKLQTPEDAAKKREAEMKARAEKLKEEMKRLKELRDEKQKEESRKKDKKK